MIDLTKPIRRIENGAPARVLATNLGGKNPVCIAYHHPDWMFAQVCICGEDEVGLRFENIPPEPATACLYVWWGEDGVRIASPDPEDAKRWRANGWKGSEHLVTEPQS